MNLTKSLKRASVLLLTLLMIISLTGCMFDLEKLSNDLTEVEEMKAEKMKEMATEYLNEKYAGYGDKFTAVGYTPPSWAYSHSSVIFDSEKYNPFRIEVQICKVDGEYVLRDNYYKLYMVEDAEKYFKEVVSRYHTPVEVKASFSGALSDKLGESPTFAEFLETGESLLYMHIITSEVLSEEKMQEIVKEISLQEGAGTIYFVTTQEPDLLAQYTKDEIVRHRPSKFVEIAAYEAYKNGNIEKY